MNIKLDNYEIVGEISEKAASLAKINYTGNIYAAPGVVKHIKRRHKNELSDNVKFLGWVDNDTKPQILMNADVLVLLKLLKSYYLHQNISGLILKK